MDNYENFPCTRCGACCKNTHKSPYGTSLDRGDGVCKYLNEHLNLCSIYESRPDICRIDLQYKKNYKQHISWNKFIELNKEACANLQKDLLKYTL
mgnify:FL=1